MKTLTSAMYIGEKHEEMISHVKTQINAYSKCQIITATKKKFEYYNINFGENNCLQIGIT
jgi:hypothetical protein